MVIYIAQNASSFQRFFKLFDPILSREWVILVARHLTFRALLLNFCPAYQAIAQSLNTTQIILRPPKA